MPEDFHDRFTDALAEGCDSHDAARYANGQRLDPLFDEDEVTHDDQLPPHIENDDND